MDHDISGLPAAGKTDDTTAQKANIVFFILIETC
jgi:hypothetical protein